MIFETDQGNVAALVRGDHEISEKKLKAVVNAETLELAERNVESLTHAPKALRDPWACLCPWLPTSTSGIWRTLLRGNERDYHLTHVNLDRDFQVHRFADVRKFSSGDRCPLCGQETRLDKGIEVGHTFKFGTNTASPWARRTSMSRHGKRNCDGILWNWCRQDRCGGDRAILR